MIKKEFCVSEEIEEFFNDYESSNKRWKLLTKFKASDLNIESKDMSFDVPKKRQVFKSKIKVYKKNSKTNKNIF